MIIFTKPSMWLLVIIMTTSKQDSNYRPEGGVIPDRNVAVKVAEAVLLPIYGETILKERPYNVKLVAGTWIITGSANSKELGGVFTIYISRRNGEIMKISHGK